MVSDLHFSINFHSCRGEVWCQATHTHANLDTEMCVAAGLINWAQLFAGAFFLEKNPGVLPYTTCTEPLPSFKIAAINQEDFKGYNAQFHGRLFQLPANVIPISPPHLLHFFPPSARLTLIPAPFALSLIRIGRLFCLSMITRLKRLKASHADEEGAL